MPPSPRRSDASWESAADEHRVALAEYLHAAERVDAAAWSRPLADGEWTPAQVTDHLARAYEVLLGELRGEGGMRVVVTPWRQRLLRTFLLPHILFHRSFPIRAPAPREVRPAEEPAEGRDALLARLRDRAERFEAELGAARRRGGGELTHAYFGTVPPVKALRFCGVHLEHHARQLKGGRRSAAAPSAAAADRSGGRR